jgi:hypothetical protein
MGELNNAGRDFFHSQVYTSTSATVDGRQEIVLFNGGTLAIPFTHVEECKGWYRDNTCTCPVDEDDE